jgi:guanylate kinase
MGLNKQILIFSAPSGSGKTTLVRMLMERYPQMSFSVSATTRPPRGVEQHGKDYYFLTEDEFRQRVSDGEFVEYEEVYPGRFYGTLKSEVENNLAAGRIILFDIDVEGGIRLKEIFAEQAVSFFIRPPDLETLRNRLLLRATDSESDIEIRIEKAKNELSKAEHFDLEIVNDNLDIAFKQLIEVIQKFCSV